MIRLELEDLEEIPFVIFSLTYKEKAISRRSNHV